MWQSQRVIFLILQFEKYIINDVKNNEIKRREIISTFDMYF